MYAYDLYLFGNDCILQEKGKATARIYYATRENKGIIHNELTDSNKQIGLIDIVLALAGSMEYTSYFDALQVLATTNFSARVELERNH